ncbi:MAG: hypothetical protein M0R51_17625 [Clostridia bacterium]|jgi:hypothetical protein|nr:hypothetical protein [Clostridia bacterium]
MKIDKQDITLFGVLMLIGIAGTIIAGYTLHTAPVTDIYTVERLTSQEIDDIQDGDRSFNNVLIFNVQVLSTGEKFGDKLSKDDLDYINFSTMHETGSKRYYFAEENTVREDLKNGDIIITRWVFNQKTYWIKGVITAEEFKSL